MGVWVTSINSGSNGNCYYVGNEKEAILIDAGLTCRETEKRMRQLDLDIRKVKAIFISHEHGDHIKGVSVISNKYKIPVFITPKTLAHSRLQLDPVWTVAFHKDNPVRLGDFIVTAFPKYHDAADAHSFVIECNNVKIGVFTDLGRVCQHLIHHYSQCNAVFLEANYDIALLDKGRYPVHLKNRIKGGFGHLSNEEAYELYRNTDAPGLQYVFLSHLSADNNRPEIPLQLFEQSPSKVKVSVASRTAPMVPVHITSSAATQLDISTGLKAQQLSLFS